jgi:uncharacterized membrane protein YidH (DUF202 family)
VTLEVRMKIIGIVLIVIGIAGILYGGFSWTRRETVIDAGPIQVQTDKRQSLPVSPIVGAVCLIAGVVMVVRK